MDSLNLSGWIGRTQSADGCLTSAMAAMLHATVTRSQTSAPKDGDLAPQLWHWAAFNDTVPLADLATDGHPKLGGFLPPIPLERRMWAGGQLTFLRALHVGEPLSRHSTITNVVEKSGAAGPMVFVTVAHEVHGPDGVAIEETQDIVYLRIPEQFTPPKAVPAPENSAVQSSFPINEALLFRYSALTFNAHRIHYDLPYATDVEKYPGLIVHGPMQATFLMALATNHKGRAPSRFKFRGIHPMFHFEDIHLHGDQLENGMSLCTASPRGHQGLQATAQWEDIT